MKICKTCKVEKPLSDFYLRVRMRKRLGRREVYDNVCATCQTATALKWQKDNWDRVKTYRATAAFKLLDRASYIRCTYNITMDRYDELLAAQNGKCAVCGGGPGRASNGRQKKYFNLDHDHKCCAGAKSCGRCVRGLLCDACNHLLGEVDDNTSVLEGAIVYLKKYSNANLNAERVTQNAE